MAYRLKADPYYGYSFHYWRKKYHPNDPFPGHDKYNEWLMKNFGAHDKSGGDYITFRTKEGKFMYKLAFSKYRDPSYDI